VSFVSLAWKSNVAITIHRFNARPVVHVLYRKPLHDNIYKQWELGGVMAIRLVIVWLLAPPPFSGAGSVFHSHLCCWC
jgi:hypothetical protein